jgi:hypothetical protein
MSALTPLLGDKRTSGAPRRRVPRVDFLFAGHAEAGALKVAQRVLEHRQGFGRDRRTAERAGLGDARGDQRGLRAALAFDAPPPLRQCAGLGRGGKRPRVKEIQGSRPSRR